MIDLDSGSYLVCLLSQQIHYGNRMYYPWVLTVECVFSLSFLPKCCRVRTVELHALF